MSFFSNGSRNTLNRGAILVAFSPHFLEKLFNFIAIDRHFGAEWGQVKVPAFLLPQFPGLLVTALSLNAMSRRVILI